MNIVRPGIAALAAVFALTACGQDGGGSDDAGGTDTASAAECSPQSLRLSFIASNTSTWAQASDEFADLVDDGTDGRVTVESFPGGQLANGNQQTELQMTQQGGIDVMWVSPIILALYLDQRFDIYSLPFLFRDHDVANAVVDGEVGAMTEEWLREKDLEPLGWGVNGFRQVTNSTRPVTSPEDMNGLQVRVAGTDLFQEIFRTMGAQPVTMSFGEVYTALEQGTIDGQENPLSIIDSSSLYSVQEHVSLWNYSYDPLVLLMNGSSFAGLCAEDQDVLRDAAIAAGQLQRQLSIDEDEQLPAELEAKGMEVVATEDVDVDAFRDQIAEHIYDEWAPIIGQEELDAMHEAVDQAEQS
jgi:tripartite ATP-independent transporter DctP family solute receptor